MSSTDRKLLFVNALTVSRVPFIFSFMALAVAAALRGGSLAMEIAAGVCMFIAGITDLFDGMLARRWQVVSTFGKMADPLMDKVFFIVTFPTLMWLVALHDPAGAHAVVMLVFTVFYILRDQWVTFLRGVASCYQADCAALWLGKVRTALSFPAAGFIYAYTALAGRCPESWQSAWLSACIAVEIALIGFNFWSVIRYTAHYRRYLKEAVRPR